MDTREQFTNVHVPTWRVYDSVQRSFRTYVRTHRAALAALVVHGGPQLAHAVHGVVPQLAFVVRNDAELGLLGLHR
jgi:hypothetical protein